MTPQPSVLLSAPNRRYAAYILDLDGTVYLGNELLPGARDTILELRHCGSRTVFLSNNPTRDVSMYVEKLTALGIPTTPADVVNPTVTLPDWLRHHAPDGKVFVIGEEPLARAVAEAGFVLSDRADEIDIVVASYDRGFTYTKLQTAFDALWQHRRARLVTTNPDAYCPLPGGRGEPDAGAIVAAIEAATGIRHVANLGKPDRLMLETVLRMVATDPADCLVVGDRLETDIAMARASGIDSAAVLTGDSTLEQIDAMPVDERPSFVLSSIGQLLPAPA